MNQEAKIEKLSQKLWSQRHVRKDIVEITRRYNFTFEETDSLDWYMLPEQIREHVRDIAFKEVERR